MVLEARDLTESSGLQARWPLSWCPLETCSTPPPDSGGKECIPLVSGCVVTWTPLLPRQLFLSILLVGVL